MRALLVLAVGLAGAVGCSDSSPVSPSSVAVTTSPRPAPFRAGLVYRPEADSSCRSYYCPWCGCDVSCGHASHHGPSTCR
jgi:hypothetical protein